MKTLVVKPNHVMSLRYGTVVRALISLKPQNRFRVYEEDMGEMLVRIQGKGFIFEIPRAEFDVSFDVISEEPNL